MKTMGALLYGDPVETHKNGCVVFRFFSPHDKLSSGISQSFRLMNLVSGRVQQSSV